MDQREGPVFHAGISVDAGLAPQEPDDETAQWEPNRPSLNGKKDNESAQALAGDKSSLLKSGEQVVPLVAVPDVPLEQTATTSLLPTPHVRRGQ